MIKNEKQYRAAKLQAQKFAKTLGKFQKSPAKNGHAPVYVASAYEEAFHLQHNILVKEIKEYEKVRSRYTTELTYDSLDQLPALLIQARIHRQMTHKDLAEKLGMKEQQVQRYESTEYKSASLARLCEVAHALGIAQRTSFRVDLSKEVDSQ